MKSRRGFIKNVVMGTVASLTADKMLAQAQLEKPIRIGIIGAENSHATAYGKLFNIDKKFPGVEVRYVWGETDAFALKTMHAGNIPYQVKDPKEMIGKIEALIVDHRHPKYHLPAAIPFLESGIPIFIDKPFCYRAQEGKEFLELAKKYSSPITSFSTVAQSATTTDVKEQVQSMKELSQVISTGTLDLDSEYGGVFFYGVHLIEPLMKIFGEDITSVKVNRHGKYGNASINFASGLFATLIFKSHAYGWEMFVENGSSFSELKPRIKEPDPATCDADLVEMFRTGKKPRTYQSILNGISVLEALEKSATSEKWVDVEYVKVE